MAITTTKNTKRTVAFVVAGVLIGFFAYQWWTSPERAVKSRLRALAATLSVPAHDGDLGRVTRLTQLRHYFADEVRLRAGASGPEIASRDALLGMIGAFTPPPGGWTIEFVDVQ